MTLGVPFDATSERVERALSRVFSRSANLLLPDPDSKHCGICGILFALGVVFGHVIEELESTGSLGQK